jgi:hypothetical protein
MRPLGKEKMNSEHNSPSYSRKFLNLEDEILFKRGRFVTPQKPSTKTMNLVIKVIRINFFKCLIVYLHFDHFLCMCLIVYRNVYYQLLFKEKPSK